MVGLDANMVDDASRTKMMSDKAFRNLSLYAKLNWLKRYCPGTMKAAYRELRQDSIVSSKEYGMKS